MADSTQEPQIRQLRLVHDFAGWLDDAPVPEAEFYLRALVVLDANVLLDLYRVSPAARDQVLKALNVVGDRLWVPHQAAVEFIRNRKQAVIDRQAAFKRVREKLRDAAANAVSVLEAALQDFEKLRLRNAGIGVWDVAAEGLDRDSLQQRLDGVMDSAIAELDRLRGEHDLNPSDMQSIDAVLEQVDTVLASRIGSAYSSSQIRSLVDEAVSFRFPNQIPPGYEDGGKTTPLRAAGDFILWRQTIDRANRISGADRLVLLITQEEKPDWWEFDKKGNRTGRPRPELVQEMRDAAEAHLRLTSLTDFLKAAGTYLTVSVTEQVIEQLRRVRSREADLLAELRKRARNAPVDLLELSYFEFETLVTALVRAIGYPFFVSILSDDQSVDAVVDGDGAFGHGTFVVEAKLYRGLVDLSTIHAIYGVMTANNIAGGIVITTGRFGRHAVDFVEGKGIHLVGGDELLTSRVHQEHRRLTPETRKCSATWDDLDCEVEIVQRTGALAR
ncbi:PIN-like domain-containing protein [Catenulispora pinisilvae]|uniref:PIN-like domain-containing protein n=1 Tax=Catenulispora pinisilvae TaxID=2705253 RepID=UPI00189285BB|nr:PIN-like domain-containing protein [Catenulispora pinisilvae]